MVGVKQNRVTLLCIWPIDKFIGAVYTIVAFFFYFYSTRHADVSVVQMSACLAQITDLA